MDWTLYVTVNNEIVCGTLSDQHVFSWSDCRITRVIARTLDGRYLTQIRLPYRFYSYNGRYKPGTVPHSCGFHRLPV